MRAPLIRENLTTVMGTNPPLSTFIDHGPIFPSKKSDKKKVVKGNLVRFSGDNLVTFALDNLQTINQ